MPRRWYRRLLLLLRQQQLLLHALRRTWRLPHGHVDAAISVHEPGGGRRGRRCRRRRRRRLREPALRGQQIQRGATLAGAPVSHEGDPAVETATYRVAVGVQTAGIRW
eukprot:COSAG01_NODE_7146_length_3331_cov_7.400062_2_plen_108_part_00